MQLTLRKAAAIQAEAARLLKQNKDNVWRTVIKPTQAPDYQSYDYLVDERRAAATTTSGDREALIRAIYEIRSKVGGVNQVSGVNALLNEQAEIEMLLAELPVGGDVFGNHVDPTPGFIEVKADLDRSVSAANYYGDTNVTINLLDQNDIDRMKSRHSTLTRRRQAIKDELLKLNMVVEIPLSETAVEILQKVDLI